MRPSLEQLEERDVPSAALPTDDVHVAFTPNDTHFPEQWDMRGGFGTHADDAWDTTKGRMRVVLAGIDTGIDYDHPDLYLNIWLNAGEFPGHTDGKFTDTQGNDGKITFRDLQSAVNQGPGKINDTNGDGRISATDVLSEWSNGTDRDGNGYVDDLVGWDFANNDNRPKDDHGHGTHTAGTMGASGNNSIGIAGTNFHVQMMALKFLGSNGSGSSSAGAAAIRYAADNGARASNNSWGSPGFSQALSDAVSYANGKGHLVVCAAGNSNSNNDGNPFYPANFTFANVISVAATDGDGDKASFSNYGAASVDLGAPGVDIYSTIPGGYGYSSGTSMAAPHVAGAVGLLVAKYPTLTATQIKAALLDSTTNSSIGSSVVADGVLNIDAALDAAGPAAHLRDLASLLIGRRRRLG